MLQLQRVSYTLPNGDSLLNNIEFTVNHHDKIALIGNNGSGKSTLLKIIAGQTQPASGIVHTVSRPYYVPQLFGQYNELTVAQALQVDNKLAALKSILAGNVSETNMSILDDDWTIEERCQDALSHWQLADLDLSQRLGTLSGGQKTRVLLAGIDIHHPQIVLLDEPSNHLDTNGRDLLYDYISSTAHTLIVVSHDRKLLNLLSMVCELSKRGIGMYGGNFDFYSEQKMTELDALAGDLRNMEKTLRKAKETERESIERQQKLDARGRKKQEKAGLPTISMNTLRNNAERSTARLKDVHAGKIENLAHELDQLRRELPDTDKMRVNFDNSSLHNGKILVAAEKINFSYATSRLWPAPLDIQIVSGERIAIKGHNGAGKTTLIKMILGDLKPLYGHLQRASFSALYVDQDYSLISNKHSVYEQAQAFNSGKLQEHEVKIRLTRFLFTKDDWDKPCYALSGGEKMKLMLCCLSINSHAPDMIILDEPTNNLDLQNVGILTSAINEYKGTIIVISHDALFLSDVNIQRSISLE